MNRLESRAIASDSLVIEIRRTLAGSRVGRDTCYLD